MKRVLLSSTGYSCQDTNECIKVLEARVKKSLMNSFRGITWGYPSWIDEPRSSTTNTPTNKPRLEDIKVIACIGDSLLTGVGVTAHPLKHKLLSKLENLLIKWFLSGEYRQNTCICGGKTISVGRLLQHYSPEITLNMRKTLLFSKGEKFNFATTGATTSQLLKQAKRFIKSTNDSEYKMLFIWIGCNDVFGKSISMLQQTFERDVVKVIELLKHPKLLIYILPLPDLTHLKANVSIIQKTRFVNEMIEKIARDTGIIFIPIPTERIPSSSQKDLISSIDNVHPSFVAQQLFAKAIWNSLTLHGTVLKTFSDTQTITLRQVTNEPYKHPVY